MGGLPARTGVMTQGTLEEVTQEAKRLATQYGSEPFILGADCTLPTEIPLPAGPGHYGRRQGSQVTKPSEHKREMPKADGSLFFIVT